MTTRAELTVQMLDPLIRELVALFAEVNVIEDAATRVPYGLPKRTQSWRPTRCPINNPAAEQSSFD